MLGEGGHGGFRLAREGDLEGGEASEFLAGREEGNLVGAEKTLRFLLDRGENTLERRLMGEFSLVSGFIVSSFLNFRVVFSG